MTSVGEEDIQSKCGLSAGASVGEREREGGRHRADERGRREEVMG